MWLWWDELDRARAVFETLHAQAAELGDESSLAYLLVMGAQIDCVRGDVAGATRHADEGYALAEQTGQATVGAYVLALRALADAIAGDVDAGRERAERALEIAARTNGRPAEHFARAALGLLEQSAGRPDAVVRALGPLVDFLRAEDITEPGTARVVPDHVEALIALGEQAAAEELLGWFEGNARRLRRTSALVGAARCRGLLAGARGDVDGAIAALRAAVELPVVVPLEAARTQLAYGSALRRSRQKAAARSALEAAGGGFDAIGARVWGDRARAELARVGGRPPSSGALTPTERRVAELVAQGLQTKQVAARLFVSPKTVEGHLSRIYGKLGVSSRTELAHRLGRRRFLDNSSRIGLRTGLDHVALRPPALQAVEVLARVRDVDLVLEAPAGERDERHQQVLADRRQLVLHARRHARVHVALHQPVALQLAQRGAEHAARHPVDLAQQLVEAMGALGEPGEHDDAPLGGEHSDGRLERLQRLVVGCPQIDGLGGACHGDRW